MKLNTALKVIGGAAIALAAYISPADAQMPEIYIGVHGGKSFVNSEVSLEGAPVFLDGIGSDGWMGGVHVGSDFKLPGGPFFIGAFGGYTFQNVETTAALGGPDTTVLAFGDSWNVGGRVGMFVGQGKVYIGGGYRSTEAEIAGLGWTKDLTGYDVVGGVSFPLARNLDFGVEGVWTHYNKEEIGTSGVNIQPEQLSFMAKLIFNFGGPAEAKSVADEPAVRACDPKMANCKR